MSTSDQIALIAAVVSILSLAATLIIAISTKAEVRAQLKQAAEQLEEAKRQFRAQNDPDVEARIYVVGTPPERAGLWLEVTNHHPTVTVNDLIAYLSGQGPDGASEFNLMFLTFGDLKPQQTLKERSLQTLDSVLSSQFGVKKQGSGMVSELKLGGESFNHYPLTLHFTYVPRYAGASKVSKSKDYFLTILREA
jgi:hypothetical protein